MRNQGTRLHGIIMQPESIHGLKDKTKTMTRRIVKPTQRGSKVCPLEMYPWVIDGERQTDKWDSPCWIGSHPDYPTGEKWFSCPYGKVGDILWVREAWNYSDPMLATSADSGGEANGKYVYKASTKDAHEYSWKSPLYMPRAACRYFLEITSIRVERLQNITKEDAMAEGVEDYEDGHFKWYGKYPKGLASASATSAINSYYSLFESINGKGSWETNPWVWVISFKQIPRPAFFKANFALSFNSTKACFSIPNPLLGKRPGADL